MVIYDEEFTDTVDRALADKPDATRIVGVDRQPWPTTPRVEKLIASPCRQATRRRPSRKGKLILLTSGTTGTPRAPSIPVAASTELKAILDRSAVAHRGDDGRGGADVSRLGLLPAGVRRVDGAARWSPGASSTRKPPWSSSTAIRPTDCAWCR